LPSADDIDDEPDGPGPEYNVQPETKNIKVLTANHLNRFIFYSLISLFN
jgi:hypothetical protein